MDPPKKIRKNVPFQTVTRNHFKKRLISESKQVKVVLKKMSPSLLKNPLSPDKKTASLSKSETAADFVELVDVSSKNQTTNTSEEVEVISPLNPSPSTSGNMLGSMPNQTSSSGNKRKFPSVSPSFKAKKPKPAVTKETTEVSYTKTSPDKVSALDKVKRSLTFAPSVSAETYTASQSCSDCTIKDECMKLLQEKIKDLEEKEAVVQRRLTLYEGLGLSQLQRNEEHQNLKKQRRILELTLHRLKRDLRTYIQEEEDEIKRLLSKRDILKKTLSKKTKNHKMLDAEEQKELREWRIKTEDFQIKDAEYDIEREGLIAENDILKEKVAKEEEKFLNQPRPIPQVVPVPEPEPEIGPCEICIELKEKKASLKKEVSELEVEEPKAKQKLYYLIEEMYNGAGYCEYLTYEINYLKERIYNQRKFHSTDETTRLYACGNDYDERTRFMERAVKLMEKNLCGKRYETEPTMVAEPLPLTQYHQERHSQLSPMESFCCQDYPAWVCRYTCGRRQQRMSTKDRIVYETQTCDHICYNNPGRIETEEGKQRFLKEKALRLVDLNYNQRTSNWPKK